MQETEEVYKAHQERQQGHTHREKDTRPEKKQRWDWRKIKRQKESNY